MVRYGKRLQQQIFMDNRLFASERVPVFKLRSCPGPLIWGGWAEMRILAGSAVTQSHYGKQSGGHSKN